MVWCFSGPFLQAATPQLKNLATPNGPRFDLSEYEAWPTAHGDGHVCLWHGDKMAAVTLTIDDNWEPDHPFWLSMQKKYGTVFTWFIITNNVNAWALWSMLVGKGHDVQSHTRSHLSAGTDAQFHDEYGGSQSDINRMMPGHKCLTLAYPSGQGNETIARQYFIAARGVYGVMNNAYDIHYMNLNSGGENDQHRIDVLLNPAEKLYNSSYYRGWLSVHYHGVGAMQAETESYLAYIKQFESQLWVSRFTDVAQYGQERDTHTLTIHQVLADQIRFTVTDSMADSLFDFPLTVKIRVNNDWANATARQDTVDREVARVSHNNNAYLLVKAVPDQGEVVVDKADPVSVRDSAPARLTTLKDPGRVYDCQGRMINPDRSLPAGLYLEYHPETKALLKIRRLP